MSGVNKVILVGNLGKDPELTYTANGTAKAAFSLAVGETFQGANGREERTTWCNIVCWQKLAEVVATNLSKGRKVYVEGKLSIRDYEDKAGQKRYITEIVAREVNFLDSKKGDSGGQYIDDDIPMADD